MSKQSSRSTSPRSANSGMARSKAATPKPASTAKTTYESILDCQNRIFEVIDNFDRIEAMDNSLGIGRVEKPDDSAYVLHYNEQELVQLSESIGKMTFADADFGVDEDSSAVEQALLESNLMIESMMSHKEDEMKKIKELVEKFRQLRRDQELQLGNTIREIKETSGVRSLEQRLLEREVQVMRLRSECEKKEELLKLVISGLEETEQSLREMYEQVEVSSISKMQELVSKTESELAAKKQAGDIIAEDLKAWQERLRVIMKDAESSEIDAMRKKKAKLMSTLSKVNEDYSAAFASHAQTLKFLVLTEKKANDTAYALDKIADDREAKKLKALEAKVEELQDSIAIGRVKLEELDAFLGDAHSVGHQKRLSAMGSSSKRGTILRADSGTGDSLSRKSPMEQSLPRDGGKSSSLDDKPLKNEANLTQLASLLPSSGFVSSTAVNLMSSVNEEHKVEHKSFAKKSVQIKPHLIAHITEIASISEIRKLSSSIMMPPPSNVGRNPRKGPNSVELLKVDASGQVGVSDKFGPLKAIHVLKDVLELMIIKPPPVANALHQEEDAAMEVKEKRLIAFSSSDSTNDQLLGMINADQAYHNSEDVGNNARLSQCKADILSLLSKANTLASLDDAQLNISLSSLREKISTVAIEMADEEAEMEKNRVRRTKQDAKWEYLCGKLAQEIVRLADAMQFDLPTDVKVYSMYSIVQEKIRIADALKERVVSAHGTDSKSNLDVLNAAEPSGIIAEFEDDMTDDVAVVVALDREKSESKERDLDSSSDSDSGEESIKPLRYRQNVDANTVASNKSSPQKYFYYNRDRRRVSSILPSGTIHGMAGGRGVHKSVGYRVLAMATQEEIAEKERLKKLEEDRFKAEQEAKENDVSASVIRKNKRIEEFQKGLMNEIRESVSSLISRNLGVSNMEGRKEKRQTTIGRLLVDNEDAANKKRTMLAGSNLEGEMNRQQLILSMIGRSTARASNAAETLKSRTQTQRPAVLQMQLELGLQKRSKEDAQHKGSLSNECVSPDNGSIDNDDHVKEVSLEETFHWLVGRYQHNVAVQPSTTIVDILNLISNNGTENSSSANDLQMIKDNLSMQTDTDITDLIEKLSIEISQNVMMNTPLSPSHSAYPGKSKECTVGSNLPEVIEDPVDDLATTGSYIAAYERTRDESDCEDSSVSNNLMNNATRIGRNRTNDLTAGAVQYSSRRTDQCGSPIKAPRRASVCAIDAPILLGVQKNSESTLQNLKVLEKSKVENSRKGRSTGASNVSTVQLTLSSNANEMLTPRKILGGHALHGKYGNVRAETSSSIMPFLGVKAHHQQKPEHEVIVEILKPSVRSKKKAIQGLVSRPITSLDAGDEEGRSATPGGIDQDVSVYSEYSAASMLAHIVIPAPELLVDSRCATAARASTGCTDQVRNVVSSDPTITDSLYFHTANEQKHIITAANLPKSINENSKELVTQSKIAKSIITDASNASSFFHDWSEGPETEFNPAVLLSSSNEESSSLAAPQPPSYCRPSKTSAGDVYNGSISTPLLKRISKATSVDVKTAEKESRGAAAKNNASKFRPIPQHYLSSSDRRILEEAVRRETLGTAAIMQPEMARPDSFGIQYGALAEILAEIENKGRNIQLAAENWREMNSTFVGSIDELEAWKRELMILKSGKNRRSDSLFSSEFSELLSSNQKKKKPPHDVQIHSTLSGYMDVAPHFHWERTVKMKDKTVQQLVNEIAAHHASPGRIDVPAVVSLLPQKSHHAAVLTGSIEGPIVADVIDVPTKDKLAVFTEVCGEDVNLPAPKKVIQLPVKKKQSSWLPPDSMKKSVLGCDVVQGRDGNQIYVIHKPASIIYT